MAVIKLQIFVSDPATVLGLFDQIQVHRSIDGTTYEEITAAAAAAATLLGSVSGPFTVNGDTLSLEVDGGAEQSLTFVTADPIAIADLVDLINTSLTGVVATSDSGALRLSSATTGTGSSIEITGGTALDALGFAVDDSDVGEDARIALVPGQSEYEYEDQSGDADYLYKTRYFNSATDAVSSFGDAIEGDVGSIITSTYLIKATVDLATLDGKPITDRRLSFHPVYVPAGLVVDSVGVVRGDLEAYTDDLGHAEVMLIKGATVDVTISGTGITRRIDVPSTGTSFDLLSAVAAADDVFQIQVPDIPAAVRRS